MSAGPPKEDRELRVVAADHEEPSSTWSPVELGPIVSGVLAGEIVGPVPALMRRSDGVLLLYPGEIHSLAGEPESCKGWIVLSAIADLLAAGETVLYLDFEDAPASIVWRLLALDAPPEAISQRFHYVRPTDPFDAGAFAELLAQPYALAVIDGLSEAYALLGLEINSNDDAAKFLAAIPRPLADRTGAAVIEIDHLGRDRDARGRYAIGAQHKLAGVACAYRAEVIDAPSRQRAGLVKLTINKDRHGHVRGHALGKTIAEVHVTPHDGGERVTVALEPPAGDVEQPDGFRPTRLMERTSRAIEDRPGMSTSELRDVPGNNNVLALARRLLIEEGHVETRPDGRTSRHYSIGPYRETDG